MLSLRTRQSPAAFFFFSLKPRCGDLAGSPFPENLFSGTRAIRPHPSGLTLPVSSCRKEISSPRGGVSPRGAFSPFLLFRRFLPGSRRKARRAVCRKPPFYRSSDRPAAKECRDRRKRFLSPPSRRVPDLYNGFLRRKPPHFRPFFPVFPPQEYLRPPCFAGGKNFCRFSRLRRIFRSDRKESVFPR